MFETVTDAVLITYIVWTDDCKLLQESNLTVRQPRRAPHHVIRPTAIEGRQGSNVTARVGFEPPTLHTEGTEPYQWATTPYDQV